MNRIFSRGDLEIFTAAYLPLDERMYLLLSGGEALLVDPNEEGDAVPFLRERGVKDLRIVLTHCHYDHIMGVNLLREHFDCTVISTELCRRMLPDPRKNMSRYAALVFSGHGWRREDVPAIPRISCTGDIGFEGEYGFALGGIPSVLRAVPGHSADGLLMIVDGDLLFTGDNLIPGTPTALTLPGSDPEAYRRVTTPLFLGLPKDMTVFPGHCDMGILGDLLKEHPDYKEI